MRVKSTWPKGQRPPVQRPKGSKNKKTLLKEAAGLSSWDKFKQFIENEGVEKCIQEINKLKGNQYLIAYGSLMEFVKPKLARTELSGDLKHEVITVSVD